MVIPSFRVDLLEDVYKEFRNNQLYNIDGRYREQKYFKEKVLYFVFNIVELNPRDKVGSMIHEFLKTLFFEKPDYDVVFIDKSLEIFPVLCKNHWAIERKKQKKLTFLANELDGVERTVETHVVRTIVKPYIRDLNLKWSKMTAFN